MKRLAQVRGGSITNASREAGGEGGEARGHGHAEGVWWRSVKKRSITIAAVLPNVNGEGGGGKGSKRAWPHWKLDFVSDTRKIGARAWLTNSMVIVCKQ